jgi:hypothetical protein
MNKDEYGAGVRAKLAGWDMTPPPGGYQLFAPTIDTFLKEHLFADIFARDVLISGSGNWRRLPPWPACGGPAGQLYFHLGRR